jgi:DNA repair protein RecN (Recombination protein N)
MLINLHVENFLIIEKTSIDFGEGLNVITGETGSGKSMIFDAIGLILGDKGGKDLIRNQSEKAFLQATFMIDDVRIYKCLENEGFSHEDTLIISRDLYASGKSLYKVNGRLVTSQFVRQLGQYLINLSGQHENQILLDSNHHRQMIDEFGQDQIYPVLAKVSEAHQAYQAIVADLESFKMSESEWHKEVDFLSYQIEEIKQAKLKEGEETSLEERYEFLKHFESVKSAVSSTLSMCKEDRGILNMLTRSKRNIQDVLPFNPALKEPYDQLESAFYAAEAATEDLRNILDNMDYDENELETLESRLATLHDLKRKFGKTVHEIHEQLQNLETRMNDLINYEERKADLERQLSTIASDFSTHSQQLSELRQCTAKSFETELIRELTDLNFNQCLFRCEFQSLEGLHAFGNDRIDFYLSTNPGEPARPLRKIASGGELSRIMLAVKLVNRKGDYATTQIFDEIDSGISGRTANAVANKLKTISKEGQVILVTHLPQIAVQGDHHLLIDKIVDEQQTKVQICKMNFEQRISEIARMIGSGEITELTKMSAKEMLMNARS